MPDPFWDTTDKFEQIQNVALDVPPCRRLFLKLVILNNLLKCFINWEFVMTIHILINK
jgi:hypothetical protein